MTKTGYLLTEHFYKTIYKSFIKRDK